MQNFSRLLVAVCVPLIFAGCASITGTTNQSVSVQTREQAGKEVIGAACELTNNKGKWFVTTPGSIGITRSNDDLQVLCNKVGYEPGRAAIVSATKGAMFGNIILGGGIGAIIDHNTGAAYEYPSFFQIVMGMFMRVEPPASTSEQASGPSQPQSQVPAAPMQAPPATAVQAQATEPNLGERKTVEIARMSPPSIVPGVPAGQAQYGIQNNAIAASPEAREWSEKSLASANRGEWAEAIRTSAVAISLAPSFAPAYINRCRAYLGHGDLDEALKDCESALRFDPNNLMAVNNRGAVRTQQGKVDAALADYERACLGGLELGCDNFRKIRGYSPNDTAGIAKNKLDEANSKFSEKDWNGAIASATMAIDMVPRNASAYVTRSGAYANLGNLPKALADVEAAIRLNPNEGLAYNNRGYVYELMNEPRKASLDYEIACSLKVELGCVNLKRIKQ